MMRNMMERMGGRTACRPKRARLLATHPKGPGGARADVLLTASSSRNADASRHPPALVFILIFALVAIEAVKAAG